MYRFEIIKNNGGACIGIGSARRLRDICEKIYDYIYDLVGEESTDPEEISSWAELNCGTQEEPATYQMDDYTFYFWED